MVTMAEEEILSEKDTKSPGKKKGPSRERIERTKNDRLPNETSSLKDDFFLSSKSKKEPKLDKEQQKLMERERKKQEELKKIRAKEEKERKKKHAEEQKYLAKQAKNGSNAHTASQPINSPSTPDGRINNNLSPPKSSQKLPSNQTRVRHIAYVQCKVELLDGTIFEAPIDRRQKVEELYDKVCDHICLEEKYYFGLLYIRNNKKIWLDLEKSIDKQLPENNAKEMEFHLAVKFYPPYPTQLQGDMTRYQLCLQVRKDMQSGILPCSELTFSLLGSYTAQSELGDYDLDEHGVGSHYLKRLPFLMGRSDDFLDKVSELHAAHRGMTPEQAEYHFLENARKLELYGVTSHRASDGDGVEIVLGVSARGLTVYRNSERLSRFVWPQITKLSYRQTNQVFYVTLRPVEFEPYKRVIGFQMQNNEEAKALWADCSEHHTFFRLKEPEKIAGLFDQMGFGSKFRFSGRTQHQMRRSLSMSSMSRTGSIARLSSARSLDGRLTDNRQ